MDHKFLASQTDPLKCGKCRWPEISHSKTDAVCESCDNKGEMTAHGNLLLCRECIAKEKEIERERIVAKETINDTLKLARDIDNSIETREQIFNASTVSIDDLKKAIDADASITNKPYALAEAVKARFEHYKEIFFKHNEIAIDAATQQRAAIQYLNTLANQLKDEERKKLQLADVSYKPEAVKVEKPKTIKIKTSASAKELRMAAESLGLESTHTLQVIMTAKQCDINGAIAHVREMQAKAKAMIAAKQSEAAS